MNQYPIAIAESYRGVGIHADQPMVRIEGVVKPEVDEVLALDDLSALAEWADDVSKSPESRLLAAAKCEAAWQIRAEERRERPTSIDLDRVRACVVGLDSVSCRDPIYYCSIFDPRPGPVPREQELDWPQL